MENQTAGTNQNAFPRPQFVKVLSLVILLALESYFVSYFILYFSLKSAVFNPSFEFLAIIGGLLLLVLYTFSLTIGIWNRKIQYLIVPFPIALGILINLVRLNTTYAVLLGLLTYLIILYDIMWATRVMNNLIRFHPAVILKTSTKGIIFLFSLIGSLYILVNPASVDEQKVKNEINDFLIHGVNNVLFPQISIPESIDKNQLEQVSRGLEIDLGPQMDFQLNQLLNNGNAISSPARLGAYPIELAKERISILIESYKAFIPPIFALVIFSTIQFLGFIVGLVYSATIGAVFSLFKKIRFLKSDIIIVEKEILKY